MNAEIDEIEHLISYLLFSGGDISCNDINGAQKHGGQGRVKVTISDSFPRMETFAPTKPLAVFMEDRLFTTHPELLQADASDIIGSEAEICMMDGDHVKWIGLRRLKSKPRTAFSRAPSDAIYYEEHYRRISPRGGEFYTRAMIAWDRNKKRGHFVTENPQFFREPVWAKWQREESNQFVLLASILEDSQLFWNVDVSNSKSIRLYTDEIAIKELADLREAPTTDSGRRKPILHWVSKHIRRCPNVTANVRRHLRGIEKFEIDGFSFEITSPSR